jgi:hypothetical protein
MPETPAQLGDHLCFAVRGRRQGRMTCLGHHDRRSRRLQEGCRAKAGPRSEHEHGRLRRRALVPKRKQVGWPKRGQGPAERLEIIEQGDARNAKLFRERTAVDHPGAVGENANVVHDRSRDAEHADGRLRAALAGQKGGHGIFDAGKIGNPQMFRRSDIAVLHQRETGIGAADVGEKNLICHSFFRSRIRWPADVNA